MTVGQICNRQVVVSEIDTGITEVAKLMRRYHVGDVVVIEKKGDLTIPVGVITDRDIIVELVASEVDPDFVTTGEVMSLELVTAQENEDIWEILQRMLQHGIRRIPIINEEGGLEGILALDDMIELLAEELSLLAKIVGRNQDVESRRRP